MNTCEMLLLKWDSNRERERERERSSSDLRPIVAVAFVVVVVVVIFRLSCLHMARAQTQPTPDTASRHMLQMLLLSTHTLACGMLARNQFALLTHDWILLIQFAATVPRHVLCMRLHVPLPACLYLSLGVCVCVCLGADNVCLCR